MEELKIVATITAKAEFVDEIKQALHTVAGATRKEEGNISYVLHEDVSDMTKLVLLEVWKSQEAIDIHNASAHFSAFKVAIDGKLEGLSINVIRKIY